MSDTPPERWPAVQTPAKYPHARAPITASHGQPVTAGSETPVSDGYPARFNAGARKLWDSLLARDATLIDELNPVRDMAIEACRAKDRLDVLDVICRTEPVMLDNGRGQPVAHPAWVEARQASNVLKQLIVALRLPDQETGKRPAVQRGSSPTRGAGNVSSLARARAARGA